MISFQRFELENGLKVIVHEDAQTPLVAINVLYNVGSRDEHPDKTGFAHLFEHLMFSGSENIADFDTPLQNAGGENNAFTNSDITNFYDILPAANIEMGLWLESDRMKNLAFDQKAFEVQKKVVVEEFKETCLNVPYGEVWHQLSSLAYKQHPYQWPTIGKVPAHIEDSTLADARDFYFRHYAPNNAILVLAGNITFPKAKALVEKWFGSIPKRETAKRNLPVEPSQTIKASAVVEAAVPADAIYLGFHCGGRLELDYYKADILSDILGSGRSSRFYQRLYKGKNLFTRIDAYISGTADPGLFLIDGKVGSDCQLEECMDAIWMELDDIKQHGVTEEELSKVKNKIESSLYFSEINILNRAMSLAFFEWLDHAEMINHQMEYYEQVNVDDIRVLANKIFTEDNCAELIYRRLQT
jgi:predicted Zn-dependent peptidase